MPVFFVKAILIRNHILLILFYRRDSERFFGCKMSLIPFLNGEVLWFILHQSNMFSTPLYPEDSSPICYEFASRY